MISSPLLRHTMSIQITQLRTASLVAICAFGIIACGTKGDSDAVETTLADSARSVQSPSEASADARGVSMVRFVNAMPGAKPLTVTSDSVAVFSTVKFGEVTPYRDLEENIKTFSLASPGASRSMATNTETMRDGGRYTIVAMPDGDGEASLKAYRDDLTPDSGKARIRVVHAAPGVDDIDVMVAGQTDPLFDDIDYGSEAGFRDVLPGETTLTVRRGERRLSVKNLPAMSLRAGSATTIVLLARRGGAVEAVTFTDSMVPAGAAADVGRR